MIYRLDEFTENNINPITIKPYDDSWVVFILTDSKEYNQFVGSVNGCAYTVKFSRFADEDWRLALGDFIEYNESNGKNIIIVLSDKDLEEAKKAYVGHNFKETVLRDGESRFLVHSTSLESYISIKNDGMLKSLNNLSMQIEPIGIKLGDPKEFSDYIMFCGGGVTGEVVVNSRQKGEITMDVNSLYTPGARLYFDAEKIAADGLLIRDGCHLKVKDRLPIKPYLIYVATAESVGFGNNLSTPKEFSEKADKQFQIVAHYNSLIDQNNDPVHDAKPLRDYMDKWDGQDFIDKIKLDRNKSVLEIGVGTGRLAIRIAPFCEDFYGIDISPKTIKRAEENLKSFNNVHLICGDFLSFCFQNRFDVIYSSLTFMHIEDKQNAINKVLALLKDGGKFVLSTDKNKNGFIDIGKRKIKVFPDTSDEIKSYISDSGLIEQYETEFANIFIAKKNGESVI